MSPRQILCVSSYPALLQTRSLLFERAGYSVVKAQNRQEAEWILSRQAFDVIVLEHCVPMSERHALAAMIKKAGFFTRVLVLHSSGNGPESCADASVDSRNGPGAILEALEEMFSHPERQEHVIASRAGYVNQQGKGGR